MQSIGAVAMRSKLRGLVLTVLVAATAAQAEILVLKGPNGQLFITNRGEKAGYQVLSRHREFFGSSGLGLGAAREGDSSRYEEAVRTTASQYALDPHLVKAVIRAESNFDPMAISSKGAMGLMQLMPDTARQHEVKNAFDPVQNIRGGVRHLRYLLDRYRGDLDLVLAAYNAGTKPVDAVNGIPNISETREYVRRVRDFHTRYRARAASLPRPAAAISKLDLKGRSLDQIYGVPILLRDTGKAIVVRSGIVSK